MRNLYGLIIYFRQIHLLSKTSFMPAKKLLLNAVILVAVASPITTFKAPVIKSGKKKETEQQAAYEGSKAQAISYHLNKIYTQAYTI